MCVGCWRWRWFWKVTNKRMRRKQRAWTGKPLCDWVQRYNADGLTTLGDRHGGATPPRLSPEQEAEAADWIRSGLAVEVNEQQGSR